MIMGSDWDYQTDTAGRDLFAQEKMRGRGQTLIIRALMDMDMPDPATCMEPCIDNDPNQTHAHRERRLMLEKQARRQANRRR